MRTLCAVASLILMYGLPSFSQDSIPFGELTYFDRTFETYDKDSDAPAVVLYEKGDVFFIVKDKRLHLIKKYHTKIKVLNRQGFKHSNVSIPLLIGKDLHEDVAGIKAITHNNGIKSHLQEEKIYFSNTQPGVVEAQFTLPNVSVGSILEYEYLLLSPFIFKLDGWEFQSTIPKIYSEFQAIVPLKYVYNRTLVGELELCTNQVEKLSSCFVPPGDFFALSCEKLTYAMEDIPAFKYDASYTLGPSNYISRLDFELSKINGLNEGTKLTTSWEDVDREYRTDKDIGKQLRYKGFFGRKIPDHLLKGADEMTKATNIYNFIRDHYSWNGGFGIYGKVRVKEAFNEKKGNVAEINMSLINLLNSAGIKSNLLLMSTRQLGLPKKTYPIMSDFNYIIAKATIDDKDYLLDATNKYHPFGILPFRALNHYGRVMDFSDASYWHTIKPYANNGCQIRARVRLNQDSKTANGSLEMITQGYDAIQTREMKDEKDKEEYLSALTEKFQNNLEIDSYKLVQERSDERKISEQIQFSTDINPIGDRIYFNPFLPIFFKQNPFLEKERNYPVDFGYPRRYRYQINITIPEGFKLIDLPQKDAMRLGDNLAVLEYFYVQNAKEVMISFDLALNIAYFEPADYELLRELFDRTMKIQGNSLFVIEKE